MGIPWWPIYIDAEMDEQGVRYTTPDGEESIATPDRLLAQSWIHPNSTCWHLDDTLRKKRFCGRLIVLRVQPNVVEVLNGVLSKERFDYSISPETVLNQNKRCVWIMVLGICILPVWMLGFFQVLGTPPIAEQPEGVHFLVGLWILKGVFFAIIIGIAFVGLIQFRKMKRCSLLTTVASDGVQIQDHDGAQQFVPYCDLHSPVGSWGLMFARTLQGIQILLPHKQTIHMGLIRKRTSQLRLPSWKVTLCIAIPLILFAPLFYCWNLYLIPDEPFTHELVRYVGLIAIGCLFLLNTAIIRWWRKRAVKSAS